MTPQALNVGAFRAALDLPEPPHDLARLASMWPIMPDRLAYAFEAAGAPLDDDQRLDAFILVGEQLVTSSQRAGLRELMKGSHGDSLAGAALASITHLPSLAVDPGLEGRLPLLPLATAVAHQQPGGRLVVQEDHLEGANGLYSRTSRCGVIVLGDHLDHAQRGGVFAHELAHAVDPGFGTVDSPGLEAFAEHLGPTIEEHQPSSMAELADHIAAALEATRSTRRPGPAAEDLAALIAFVASEVTGSLAREAFPIAADRYRHT